jgi:hypothetical protein
VIKSKVTYELRNIKVLRSSLRSGDGPVVEVMDASFVPYRQFIVDRFDRFSRGGGNWKQNTPARRRRKGHNKILVDTRFLRLKLLESIRILKRVGKKLIVGFESTVVHPNSKLTIEELENIHDQGLGSNPKRQILVKPDGETKLKQSSRIRQVITDFLNG